MENKIVIAIATLMVVALAAPVVMAADVPYTATVSTAANVAVGINGAAFGSVLAGTTHEITDSLTLTNTGNSVASVSAKFTTNDGGTYGLTTSTNTVIGGSNFQIGIDGSELALSNGDTNTALAGSNVAASGGTVNYDAILTVPAGQEAGDYTGNVLLTFTSV